MAVCNLVVYAVLALGVPSTSRDVDFDTDVAPILTKAGCNAAACHGAAAGRGNFKLSLFAGDLTADYEAIVRQFEGRRINVANPEASLLLAKPLGLVDHEGGVRFDYGDQQEVAITKWIAAGARRSDARRYRSLRIVFDNEDSSTGAARLLVQALLEDRETGEQNWVDVTRLSVFATEDADAIKVDDQGVVTVQRGGRHAIVVRFLNLVATAQITRPLSSEPLVALPSTNNFIDQRIDQTLAELRLPAAERADDAQLLRRLYLDLTGRLPSTDAVNEYANSTDSARYEQLVDQLLHSAEFTDYWTYQLAQWLKLHAPGGSDFAAAEALRQWLHLQVQHGTGLHDIARQLVLSEGDSHAVGPAAFYRLATDARQQAEYVSESLLGIRLRCANCHNHPLDRWTQDDYHGLAAIFARMDTGQIVRLKERGEVIHPGTGQAARSKIPGEPFLHEHEDGRAAFAAWMTSDESNNPNPYFARAAANRLWKALMGRGLIEPVDDLRDTNPATHPALLDDLARELREHNFDLRHMIRLIVLTDAYQRSSQPPTTTIQDDRFYSHYFVRRLPPAVLADAIDAVTGVPTNYPSGNARAIAISDAQQAPLLEVLGACPRGADCSTAASSSIGLAARLHLFNGELLNQKLASSSGNLQKLLDINRTNEQIVNDFYMRSLGRPPRPNESEMWVQELNSSDSLDRREGLEDFVWAILNCQEFVTNH